MLLKWLTGAYRVDAYAFTHSQMSIRENLEMEGLYVCHEQGQFSVAAVSW